MTKRVKTISIIVIALLLVGGGYYFYNNFISGEGQAKKFAEKYMKTVGQGGDVYDYIGFSTEGFIDVFDYKYLETIEMPEEKYIRTFNYDDYEWESDYFEDYEYDTYEEYKTHYIELYQRDGYEIVRDDDLHFEVWRIDDYIERYKFLYDVTIANGMGQKIYKKAEITVEDYILEDWRIEDIYIR